MTAGRKVVIDIVTDVEKTLAERPVLRKEPRCIRCKIGKRLSAADGNVRLDEPLRRADRLTQGGAALARSEVERYQRALQYLVAANRGRYCASCVDSVKAFADKVFGEIETKERAS